MFDLSSERKFEEKIDGKISADDRENVTYLSFGRVQGDIASLDVTLFVRRKDGAFDRFDELHTQYVYTLAEIEGALALAGFEIVSASGYSAKICKKRIGGALPQGRSKIWKSGKQADFSGVWYITAAFRSR